MQWTRKDINFRTSDPARNVSFLFFVYTFTRFHHAAAAAALALLYSTYAMAVFVSLRFLPFHHFLRIATSSSETMAKNCHRQRTTAAIVCNRCAVNYQHSANWSSLVAASISHVLVYPRHKSAKRLYFEIILTRKIEFPIYFVIMKILKNIVCKLLQIGLLMIESWEIRQKR